MIRTSTESITKINNLRRITSLLTLSNFSSSSLQTIDHSNSNSNYTSSSLQKIDHSNSNPPLSPFYNLLPPSQNPNEIVNLIWTNLIIYKIHPNILHNELKSIIAHLGPTEISRVLLRCQSDHISALRFFNWVRIDLGLRLTKQNYCHLVIVLVWAQQFIHAAKLLRELIVSLENPKDDIFRVLLECSEECNLNPAVFDLLVRAYVITGRVVEAFVAFGKIVEFGFVPSIGCCNFLLNALDRTYRIEQCWIVYEEMVRIGIVFNTSTYNIFTHVVSKCGDADKVKDFIVKMERNGFEPDVITFNILMGSYCRMGKLKEAIRLFQIMFLRKISPNLICYTVLMNGFCKQGRLKEANQVFLRMIHAGVKMDVVAYNTLIEAYSEAGLMRKCKSLVDWMIHGGICPNNMTCRLLVRGYQKERNILTALKFVVDLERLNVCVSLENYEFIIIALCRENRPFIAKWLWEKIAPNGYKPNGDTYKELARSLSRRNRGSEALLVKEEMSRMGFKPDEMVYKALVECFCRNGGSEEGESLVREMVEAGLSPNQKICRALVRGHCREKRFEKAESVLVLFAKEFRICDTQSYNELVKAISKLGDVSKLMDLQKEMQRMGYTPNSLTCKYVIEGIKVQTRQER